MTREQYLDVLGLDQTATWEEICLSYQAKCEEQNPDRFEHDERLQIEARQRLEELMMVYRCLAMDPVIRARTAASKDAKKAFGGKSRDGSYFSPAAATNRCHRGKVGTVPTFQAKAIGPAVLFVALNFALSAGSAAIVFGALSMFTSDPDGRESLFVLGHETDCEAERDAAQFQLAALEGSASGEPEQDWELTPPFPAEQPVSPTARPESEAWVSPAPAVYVIPESAFKLRDKMYVLNSSNEVLEHYINLTPDIIDSSINCDLGAVRALLDDGADPETADVYGETALTWAVKRRCYPVAKLLIEQGVDVNRPSANGFTPYVWARTYKSYRIQSLLEEAGADTKAGSYWWRNEQDASADWLYRSLQDACRNQDCTQEK